MTLVLTIVGVVVSFAAAGFVLWQSLLSRRSMGAETLLHLDDQWDSDGWLRIRAAAYSLTMVNYHGSSCSNCENLSTAWRQSRGLTVSVVADAQ